MKHLVTAMLIVLCSQFGGCAGMVEQDRKAVFDPAEYASYLRGGNGAIAGQAFMVTRGGDVKFGAGREVVANPVTTYSTEWFERGVMGGERLKPPAPGMPEPKRVVADGNGRFTISGLAAGDYYVACWIVWEVPTYGVSGGWVGKRVTVRDGQTTEVVLTR